MKLTICVACGTLKTESSMGMKPARLFCLDTWDHLRCLSMADHLFFLYMADHLIYMIVLSELYDGKYHAL